jgi:hypothetical protein
VQRQQLEAAIVDFHVQVVDSARRPRAPRRAAHVAIHQSADRFAHALFRQPAHRQQRFLELIELLLKVPKYALHQPHLPVT